MAVISTRNVPAMVPPSGLMEKRPSTIFPPRHRPGNTLLREEFDPARGQRLPVQRYSSVQAVAIATQQRGAETQTLSLLILAVYLKWSI